MPATTNNLEGAIAIRFDTFTSKVISEVALLEWVNCSPADEIRRVNTVHDVATSLLQIDAEREITVNDAASLLLRVRSHADLPTEYRLGTTYVLVVKTASTGAGSQIARQIFGQQTGRVFGGSWRNMGEMYEGNDPSLLVIVCPPGKEADDLMSAHLYETIRTFETYRHKFNGQFEKYRSDYREPLLATIAILEGQLQNVSKHEQSLKTIDADDMAAVTQTYCSSTVSYAPVRECQAMLRANFRNLQIIQKYQVAGDAQNDPGAMLLLRRTEVARIQMAQIEADLGRAHPVLEAARGIGQFQHGQLLAQMTETEQKENTQREAESNKRERQMFRLTLLAAWLGISQVWSAWVALWPNDSRPSSIVYLLALCFLPTIAGGLIYFAFQRIGSPTNRSQ